MSALLRISTLAVLTVPLFGGSFQFQSPVCGAPLSGLVTLAVSGVSGGAARVDYAMGSHLLGSGVAPGFTFDWNSAEAMDGDSAIQAVARNSAGTQIDSVECVFRVSNRQVSVVVNSPDLSEPLSGSVAISVTGADAVAFPAIWTLNIDGEQQGIVWTDNTWTSPLTVTFQLDTTRFVNGSHELHISMNGRTGPANPQWINWRGMVNRVVQFDNGHTWMDTIPGLQNIYLAPGETAQMGCRRLYTDGASGPCAAPVFAVEDANVAGASAAGVVSALQPGFTRISVTDGSKSATAGLWVDSDHRVPHFSGDGELRRGYVTGSSLFVIAPFFLDPSSLEADPQLRSEIVNSGINTLSFGAYLNPRDTGASLSDWEASYDQTVAPKLSWAAKNGFHLLLTGDDMFRRIGGDAWYTLNWPYGKEAVQYAMAKFAASGVGIGIEGIDEASSIWGPRPVPEGKIAQAPYLFDRVDCLRGQCTVQWTENMLSNGTTFALRGSSTAGLNTPAGSLYKVSGSTSGGFQFTTNTPVTGSFTQATDPSLEYLWFAGRPCTNGICNPPVPNDALATIRGWMTENCPGVHMAFPPLAVAPPSVHGAWMGPGSISDYASNYFSSMKTRTTYPWSEGIQEMVSSMTKSFEDRQPLLMRDRPQLMLVSVAGASYTKETPGAATYQAGTDLLDEPGVGPDHVSALMMTAAALGGAGIRLYYYEPASDVQSRADAPLGTVFQTGSNPFNLQAQSWQAMAYASSLLTGVLPSFLLSTAANSPALGRNIVTAVRSSDHGKMLMIVNGNDWPRTFEVNLMPYLKGSAISAIRLRSTGITRFAVSGKLRQQTVTLAAGETIIYLFGSNAGVPSSRANSLF